MTMTTKIMMMMITVDHDDNGQSPVWAKLSFVQDPAWTKLPKSDRVQMM